MSFFGAGFGIEPAVVSAAIAADSDLIADSTLDAEGYNLEGVHSLESDPFDILVGTGVYLHLNVNRYSGDWWIHSRYIPNDNNENEDPPKCRRIRCNYKWNRKTSAFDIKYYCYTKLPKTRIDNNSYSSKTISRTDDIYVDVNTGEYYIREAIAMAPNKNRPRKLHMKFLDSPNSAVPDSVPNFLIFKTDYCNYSIVGTPNRGYLWVLTRKYALTPIRIKQIFLHAATVGFRPYKLTADPSAIYKGRKSNLVRRGY